MCHLYSPAGLLGYVRLCLPRHEVVESKPDATPYDLRMAEPFDALAKCVVGRGLSGGSAVVARRAKTTRS